jgi:hypothetical protein
MLPRTNKTPPDPDQWKRLLKAWPRLHPWQRKVLVIHALCLAVPRLHSPVAFAVRTAFAMFALLLILPHHPMSIPIASGGSLAFALITH